MSDTQTDHRSAEYIFDAVRHFPNEYFDLIYIDSDHTYEACLEDIKDWFPKVKKDRFLLGDSVGQL